CSANIPRRELTPASDNASSAINRAPAPFSIALCRSSSAEQVITSIAQLCRTRARSSASRPYGARTTTRRLLLVSRSTDGTFQVGSRTVVSWYTCKYSMEFPQGSTDLDAIQKLKLTNHRFVLTASHLHDR